MTYDSVEDVAVEEAESVAFTQYLTVCAVAPAVSVNVADVAPEIATPVPDVSLYHWQVYGDVPPDAVAVNDTLCPVSYVADVGDIETDNAELTVTKSVPDVADVAVVAESVTLQQQYVFDVGLAEYVEDVAPEIAVSDEHVDEVPEYH